MLGRRRSALAGAGDTIHSLPPLASRPGVGKGGTWRPLGKEEEEAVPKPCSAVHLLTCSPAAAIWSDSDPAEPRPHRLSFSGFLFHQRPPRGPESPMNPRTGN